tara:strand:- start:411 stop:620 length:210 start_codon:yes stop_codon:yes gene_type:complete
LEAEALLKHRVLLQVVLVAIQFFLQLHLLAEAVGVVKLFTQMLLELEVQVEGRRVYVALTQQVLVIHHL